MPTPLFVMIPGDEISMEYFRTPQFEIYIANQRILQLETAISKLKQQIQELEKEIRMQQSQARVREILAQAKSELAAVDTTETVV